MRRNIVRAGLVLLAVGLVFAVVGYFVFTGLPGWFWRPLGICNGTAVQVRDCKGYNFWSGIGSDIGEITIIVGMISFAVASYRRLECHQDGCHKLGRYRHGHYVLCSVHHPLVPDDGVVTAEHIAGAGS